MSLLESLNQKQKEAVTSINNHVRIIAGAGSGKTRVLTTRIAYLIETIGIDPRNILAITFTNKAANEMKERVGSLLGPTKGGVHISTIHSLCVRILREDINKFDYPKNFSVMDSDDQKTILKEAYKQFGIDLKTISFGTMLNYISNNKYGNVSAKLAFELASNYHLEEKKAQVYEYYLNRQDNLYALDFDDLLLKSVKLFRFFPQVLKKWQNRFNYIHVDEFQDTDEVQYELIKMLTGENNYLCVVGDPDQTIYTWRGANISIILNFNRDFANVKTITLDENYRSTKNILNSANKLIKNNHNRIEKDLITNNDEGHKIVHYSANDEDNEANYVASKIIDLKQKNVSLNEIAVLYRANYLSRSLEKAFKNLGINYKIIGGLRFYDRMEVKDAICYLKMVNNGDDLSLKRIINTPRRGIGDKSIDTVFEKAKSLRCSIYDAFKQDNDILSGKAKQEFKKFQEKIEKARLDAKDKSIALLLKDLLEDVGYIKMLEEDNEEGRLENIKELLQDIEMYEKNSENGGSLDEYLQLVSLYTDKDVFDLNEAVTLMTVHMAKGLEFDYVFIFGMCENIFPSLKTIEEKDGIEEERRLAYVACTRARKQLYLTDSTGYSHILQGYKQRSRFIEELDNNNIMHNGAFINKRKDDEVNPVFGGAKIERSKSLKKGDKVEHTAFGEGVVIKVDKQIVEVAFKYPHNVKKLMANHPALKKIS